MKEALGISCMVVDANDIDVEILGKSPDLADKPAALLADLIRDNPRPDDELTPFVIVRDIGDREAMPMCRWRPWTARPGTDGPAKTA
ncbi:MAG: hypothetical protein ACLRXC_08190 [[Clostridium] leptum]